MGLHLSADELADLVQCRPNQRSIMARWLDKHGWRWVPGRGGLPRVAREFYNKKMGITDVKAPKLEQGPDLSAFSNVGGNRRRPTV